MADYVYWDSDCFLSYLQAEAGKMEKCQEVLQDANDGKILIVTSALTLAEVLKMRGRTAIPKAEQETVAKFFLSSFVVVRNVTRKTSEVAREIVWNYGINPKDAIHVATALENKLTMLHTFDDGLLKKSGQLGGPPLIIAAPFVEAPKLPGVN